MDAAITAGTWLMEVDMMPVFFTAHFMIANIIVREDSKDLGPKWRHEHPFTSWLCTVMCGLSGVFVHNFLFGESLVDVFTDHALVIFCTVMWYVMNYSPFDVAYTLAMSPPILLSASVLQEVLRLRFLYLGMDSVAKSHPGAYVLILLGGIIKGNGYGFLKMAENLVRGKWNPGENDLLNVSYFAKSGAYASVLFLLHITNIVSWPLELTYLALTLAFISLRLTLMIGEVKDPLLPLEAPVTWLLFGDWKSDKDAVKAKVQQVKVNSKQSKKKN